MTKITIDRSTVEQALEALRHGVKRLNHRGGTVECLPLHEAITALRAALVEDALQRFTDVNQELEAALSEPVQEPVAWMHTDPDNPRVKFLVWRENEPAYRGVWIKTPLYAAPPQRKPLTIKEINALPEAKGYWPMGMNDRIMRLIRAVEGAHGIK